MTKDGAAPLAAFVLAAFIFPFAYLLLAAPTPSFFLTSLDHGYQLAVADMLLAGKVQGVDLFTHYGPFVGYASGAARLLGGKFIGEVVLCAAGYGASCALIFGLVARFGGRHAAAITVISFLMLLPRFYKWYYCFFPLVALALSLALVDRLRARQSILLLLLGIGVVSGIALFFRMDLGLQHTATILFALLVGHLATASNSEKDWTQRLLLHIGHGTAVAAGVALVIAAYAALLDQGRAHSGRSRSSFRASARARA